MKRQIFYTAVCSLSMIFLQACSDSDSVNNPWQTPVALKSTASISASKATSNDTGDLLIVWEEQETQQRVNQALTDAHNPSNPNYDGHEVHTHIDIYQRTNVYARVYDADAGLWQSEASLQTGLWKKFQTGEKYTDTAGVEQFRLVENVTPAFSINAATATNTSGNAIVAWIQSDASATTVEDAASTYSINVAFYTSATNSWSAVEKITVNQTLVLTDLNVSFDDSGKAQLLWLARDIDTDITNVDTRITNVYTSAYDGTNWGAATLLSDGKTATQSVQVKMYSADAGVAVWTQQNTNAKSVYQGTDTDPCIADATICNSTQLNLYTQWFDSNGWQAAGTEKLISNALGEVTNFSLKNNGTNVWLIWEQKADHLVKEIVKKTGFPDRTVYPRQLSDASLVWVSQFDTAAHTWSTPVQLQADDATTTKDESAQLAIHSDIAVDGAGNVMAVWIQQVNYDRDETTDQAFIGKWNNNVRQSVWINTFMNNAWVGAKLLDNDDRFSNASPKVLATSTGQFTIAWVQWESDNQPYGHSLYSLDYDALNNTVGVKFKIDSNADLVKDFYLAKDQNNQIQIIWTGDATAIKYSTK